MGRSAARRQPDLPNDRLSLAPAREAERWERRRTLHHRSYTPAAIAAACRESGLRVSVCLPARECATTVGPIVEAIAQLREQGAIAQIVVVDAASRDGTARAAARAGAEVWQERELLPELGPVLGKGDAMWRALSALEGEVVCFMDADSEGFRSHFVTGLLGPLLCEPGVSFVKGFYRRPLAGVAEADGGGRVNHLTARPALALFYPQLARVRQPLAGEIAARRDLLERIPFVTGYGVEIAMLIDVWRQVGLEGMAQVDLEEHHNRHQPLAALAPMALTVLATLARRMEGEGRLAGGPAGGGGAGATPAGAQAPLERPPLASWLGAGGERRVRAAPGRTDAVAWSGG